MLQQEAIIFVIQYTYNYTWNVNIRNSNTTILRTERRDDKWERGRRLHINFQNGRVVSREKKLDRNEPFSSLKVSSDDKKIPRNAWKLQIAYKRK